MRLSDIRENASAGSTTSANMGTTIAGGTPPKGQFFGGDPASSIYTQIKKHRKSRKEEVTEKVIAPVEKVKNWLIRNEKTGKFWNGKVTKGWTDSGNAELFSSDKLGYELPSYGRWVNLSQLSEKSDIAKTPKKPSGKAEVIGGSKPYKQPNVLSPTMKVKSTGKMLGGAEKKNPTLSTKFFGTCSANNDPGDKLILGEAIPLDAKCKICKHTKGDHKGKTGECPVGKKSRAGWITFHPTNTFQLNNEVNEGLSYNEFRNASKATTKVCPACEKSFKNVHDANQKFCSQDCETNGKTLVKLKEEWEKPIQTEFEMKDGQKINLEMVVNLVNRVVADSHGKLSRLEACTFVAGMLKNCVGWNVAFALGDYARQKSAEMYKDAPWFKK